MRETMESSGCEFVTVASAHPPSDTPQESSRREIASNPVTDELKRLFRQSSHYLTGLTISLALGFISFPIFTRMFSVADYGTIDLVAKVLLLLTALSKMGLQQSALRFYDGPQFSSDQPGARRYYSTMFCGMALTGASAMLLFLVGIGLAPKFWIGRSLTALLFLVAGLILVRAVASVLWVFLRVEEKTKLYSLLTVAIKAATIPAICLFIPWLGRSVRSYYSGTIVVEVAVVAMLSMTLFRRGLVDPHCFDLALFRAGLTFGLPLIFYELAGITLDAGDRILVRHYLGADALGQYSVAYGLSDYVNNLFVTPLNLALAPIFIKLWMTEGQEKTGEFLSRGLALFFFAAAGVFAMVASTAHDAVTLLASSRYRGADALLPILVAGLLIYTSQAFLSAGLIIHKDTVAMAKSMAYSAILNLGLNCVLLPRMGLKAAAIATLLSYIFCVVLLGRASFRRLPVKIDLRSLTKYALAASLAWCIASLCKLGQPLANMFVSSIVSVAVYIGSLYLMDSRVRVIVQNVLRGRRHPLAASDRASSVRTWLV